jgi:Tfp pilus assembly protein PilF
MKTLHAAIVIVTLVLASAGSVLAQDWRGMGRLAGTVVDESGAPVEGVVVKAQRVESQGGPQAKTNKKGEWVLAGINAGLWNLDFDKPGFETRKQSAVVAERSPNASMKTTLKKAEAAAVDPNVAIRADLAKAADLMQQQKFGDARAIYQTIFAQHPEAHQVEPYIARTYYAEHQLDPAIEHLRAALAKDPDNVEVKLLLANVLGEKGSAEESRQVIASIDESKIKDPIVLVNVGIGLLNQKKADEALTWFDRAVTRFPQSADGYYYRGITRLQQGKTDVAKADLTKFVEMSPNAPETATAKAILETIK